MQKDMLAILQSEGHHDLTDRGLMRLRTKHDLLLRTANNGAPDAQASENTLLLDDSVGTPSPHR